MEENLTPAELIFVKTLADGGALECAMDVLCVEPWNLGREQVEEFYRRPELLQAAIETANNQLGQVWGAMWQQIKRKAALGSIQESKLLIDFVQEKKTLPFSKLRVTFDGED